MTIFDNLINIDENGDIAYNQWIEWDHYLVPNINDRYRLTVRHILKELGHCMICTALDGGYYIERNMPKYPLNQIVIVKK